uniref:Uncharacterized protein n=1 Tax=Arundo donax TaxID=35708 RepID=A0A0A9ATD1_ARUDO
MVTGSIAWPKACELKIVVRYLSLLWFVINHNVVLNGQFGAVVYKPTLWNLVSYRKILLVLVIFCCYGPRNTAF